METRDIFITPLIVFCIIILAYLLRSLVTDVKTRPYFIPALTLRIVASVGLGLIYQFYYSGGDTFNYHTYGSRIIWGAILESPMKGFKLLINSGEDFAGVYDYASRIIFFGDPASYAVVRIAAFFDLFTFSTYSATAVMFAVVSFIGSWLLFMTFYDLYPRLVNWLAPCTLFIPSVLFWGSGILKDSITLALLGLTTHLTYKLFIKRKFSVWSAIVLGIALYGIYIIKLYILLAFIPSVILWIFLSRLYEIRSLAVKVILFPVVISIMVLLGYYAVLKAGQGNRRYSLSKLAETARITAYDIRYYTGRNAGSGYSLGKLDGTWQGMLVMAPAAINVSLFRPYIWEFANPLMFLSALESLTLAVMTIYVIVRRRADIIRALTDSNVLFCLLFSITFAFAVGVSTYNFGTLVRYKIPLMPFYVVFLILVFYYPKRATKDSAFAATEK